MPYPRFPEISPDAWEHPADGAALRAMRVIPGLDIAISATLGRLNEAHMRARLVRDSQPVSERNHPDVHGLYRDVLGTFDAALAPPLYVVDMGGLNAGAVGMRQPFLIISNEVLRLPDASQRVILAHEIGHLLSGHVLYRTMLRAMLTLGWVAISPALSWPVQIGVMLGLMEWERKSELSADRASALAMGSAGPVRDVLDRVGGMHAQSLRQQVEQLKVKLSPEVRQKMGELLEALEQVVSRHPSVSDRIREVERYGRSAAFKAALDGQYPRRGAAQPASAWRDVQERGERLAATAGETVLRWRARVLQGRDGF